MDARRFIFESHSSPCAVPCPHMCNDSLTLRIFFATLFTADWIASSGGFIVTVGTVSSTSTSKNGRSTNRNPPD